MAIILYTTTHCSPNCDTQINRSNRSGFTLIELSIVLVIIGLIVGAITAGSSLIKQATLRSVISEVKNIEISINTFKLTYNGLPGDLSNATSYWTSLATSQNGNGDGNIDQVALPYESSNAWLMLTLAGLTTQNIAAGNFLNSKYGNNAQYAMFNSAGTYNMKGNQVNLSKTPGTWHGAVTPIDAYNIDLKIDDGVAYKGIVYSVKGQDYSGAKCIKNGSYTYATPASSFTSADDYTISGADTTTSCWMFFWIFN
jgi:prepilin-type N-terminal cleavage/methylation domain-containing protein